MIRSRIALIAAAALAIVMPARALVINSYKLAGPHAIATPVLSDSLNPKGEKYNISTLFGTRISQNGTADIKAGADGVAQLPAPGAKTALYGLQTRLRAESYMKGTLKITSPARFEVKVDGESKAKKTEAEASMADAKTKEVKLSLAPEAAADIHLNILSDGNAAPQVKMEFIPDGDFTTIPVQAGADVRTRFSLATTTNGPRVGSTAVSPDGKYVIVRYSEQFSHNSRISWSTLVEAASGKVVNARLNQNLAWMPSGSTLYFCETAANNSYNVYTMDAATGATQLRAAGVPQARFTWSPTEDYLIYSVTEKGTEPEKLLRRHLTPDDRMPGNRDRTSLRKYDIATGVESILTYGAASTTLADISPDGSKALVVMTTDTPSKYPFYASKLMQVDMRTLAVDTIVSALGESGFATALYSPDAKQIFIVAGPTFAGNVGLNAGDHPIANEFDMQGYLLDLATRKVEPLTRDFNPSIGSVVTWNRSNGLIYFTAVEGFQQNIYELNPVKKSLKRLDTQVAYTSSFSMGRAESAWLTYVGQGFDYTGRAYILDVRKGSSRLLADPMAEYLSGVDMATTKPWNYTNSKGDVIEGQITLPPDFDPSKKYPLIVYYYGGTTPSTAGMTSPYCPQMYASRDYVVYTVNPSGTIGYGQEFSARHVNAWGKQTAADIIDGVKAFCKAHPFVDDKKIGCLGASYGGFMTQYLQTQTDIFAAAVSHAGISNVTSYWGEGYWGYSYNAIAAAESYPWTNPKLFTEQGSLFNADKIHTPLLLLHGTVDTNVPIGESIQLFNALKILGRDVEFISVKDQDHFVLDHPHKQMWQDTIMAWFAKWLKGQPQWWDSMYGK